MTDIINLGECRHKLAISEKIFIPPILEHAGVYLCNNRNDDGTWGHHKNAPTDIHISSIAIEALQICKENPEFRKSAENSIAHLRLIIDRDIESIDIRQLIDGLNIVSGSDPIDRELESKLAGRLISLRNGAGWGKPLILHSLSCEATLALMRLGNPPKEIIKEWVEYLIQIQNSEDGGWGTTSDSKSSVIATCQTLRVINRYSDKSFLKTNLSMLRYLSNYFQTHQWKDFDDIFIVSSVLRTLCEVGNFPYLVIHAGINHLYENVNLDGGWGATKGEPSELEHTSLSMIALVLAGENRFVPTYLANAIIATGEKKIEVLKNKLNMYSENLKQNVEKEIDGVIKERDKYLKERNEYQKNLDDTRKTIGSIIEERNNLNNQINSLGGVINKLNDDINKYSNRIKYLEAQLDALQLDVESRRGQYSSILRITAISTGIIIMASVGIYLYKYTILNLPIQTITPLIVALAVAVAGSFITLHRQSTERDSLDKLKQQLLEVELLSRQNDFAESSDFSIIRNSILIMSKWPVSKKALFLLGLRDDLSLEKIDYLANNFSSNKAEYVELKKLINDIKSLSQIDRYNVLYKIQEIINNKEDKNAP